jgi:putative ABC transport system permease protein
MVLATMGIYGVMAYVVSRRTHEIGVRMALGAQKADVSKMVIVQGMRVVLIGVVIGLIAAFGVARILASQMGALNPLDPVSFIGITSISLLAALLACYRPARRAAKVDPMTSLRYE